MASNNTGLIVKSCSCVSVLVIIAIVCILSISKLEPNEMGLDYSEISYSINFKTDESGNPGIVPYNEGGLAFLGPGHSFIKFPKTVQKIDMQSAADSIMSRTKDGLEVNIFCRVNYVLKQDQFRLASLYLMFEDQYEEAFRSVARGVVRDKAAEFEAFQFWTFREVISTAIQDELNVRFQDMHADISNFLLASFVLPEEFKTEITRTDEKRQEYEARLLTQQREQQDIEARRLQAVQAIRVIDQEADTKSIEISNNYAAEAFKIKAITEAEIDALKSLKDALNLTNAQVTNLVWLDTLKNLNNEMQTNFYLGIPEGLDL